MELRSFVATLVQTIWEMEQRTHREMDAAVVGYVRDAVAVELEHRRKMEALDRRIRLLADPAAAPGSE